MSRQHEPMRVLVTGSTGQLGTEILQRAPRRATVIAHDRASLDITDERAVRDAFAQGQPDVIINAAAYTAVDRAETDREMAFRVNGIGPGILAAAAADRGASLIHVSTDFVFDGTQRVPYRPDATRNPINVYGASKLAGEDAVLDRGLRTLIIRTSWLYSAHGSNFVRTMLRRYEQGADVRVVDDQVGSPTWAGGLADAVWAAASKPELTGVMHWCDAGSATWHELACAIHAEASSLRMIGPESVVRPVSTEEFGNTTPRPRYSVLDTTDSGDALGLTPAPWRDNLRRMLEGLCSAA